MTEQTPIPAEEPVADAAMDAKMRELWAKFERPWIRNALRESLPPTRVSSMGCEFVVHPRDNFTEFRMWEKGLPPEHEATIALAERLEGMRAVIVDVGANAGAFFLPILKRAGGKARAVVFEPNPVMQARLSANIALNRLKKVTVFDCAVGAETGKARMYFPKNGNLGQGRVGVDYDGKGEEGIEVAIRPLADCLAEAKVADVDLLKVDVEGLEDRVIGPLLQNPDAPRPAMIYFEIAHDGVWELPLLEILAEAGYEQTATFGANALFERSGD